MLQHRFGRPPDRAVRLVVRNLCAPERRPEPLRHCGLPRFERPDDGFADRVLATAAKGDAPDFEMPAGTGNDTGETSSSGHPTSRNTTPATAPSETLHDDEPACRSPLFPLMAKPSESSPSEQKSDAQTVPPTAAQPHVDSVFVPRSVQQSAPKS